MKNSKTVAMEKFNLQWHRVGISINSITESTQCLCFVSPEIANLLIKQTEINKRYFATIGGSLKVYYNI